MSECINISCDKLILGSHGDPANQGSGSIAIGQNTCNDKQGINCIAIGRSAGYKNQCTDPDSSGAIAIGDSAGAENQGDLTITFGANSGQYTQGPAAISFGYAAGHRDQGENCIALGTISGNTNQGRRAIAIGSEAGRISQGKESISIGTYAGYEKQGSNTIVLNATGEMFDNDSYSKTNDAFYVKPIRKCDDDKNKKYALKYNDMNGEITFIETKHENKLSSNDIFIRIVIIAIVLLTIINFVLFLKKK